MKIVGLTGGIGSGKTTVANLFSELKVPIYIADKEAKALMNRSKVIRRKLIQLFGKKAYKGQELNRPYLAEQIFNDKNLLQQMNAIVHPKVASHFKRWMKKQTAPYCIKEVAILFENGSYVNCDKIITVIAPLETRISRVLQRDQTTTDKIEAIIKNQWQDEERIKLSDYVISNDDELQHLKSQVNEIHQKLMVYTQ
ncbi:MAG: dephospho-CoA kinase [bacterium]